MELVQELVKVRLLSDLSSVSIVGFVVAPHEHAEADDDLYSEDDDASYHELVKMDHTAAVRLLSDWHFLWL